MYYSLPHDTIVGNLAFVSGFSWTAEEDALHRRNVLHIGLAGNDELELLYRPPSYFAPIL